MGRLLHQFLFTSSTEVNVHTWSNYLSVGSDSTGNGKRSGGSSWEMHVLDNSADTFVGRIFAHRFRLHSLLPPPNEAARAGADDAKSESQERADGDGTMMTLSMLR